MEGFTLNTFLLWLISGGATIIVRLIVARIPAWKESLSEGERSAISMLFAVILIGVAFMGAVYAAYIPRPETGLEWFEALFVPVGTALGLPALMTTTMSARSARSSRGIGARSVQRNKLFGIYW